MPFEATQLFPMTMRLTAPHRPAMQHAEPLEPQPVEFANHKFSFGVTSYTSPHLGFSVSAFALLVARPARTFRFQPPQTPVL